MKNKIVKKLKNLATKALIAGTYTVPVLRYPAKYIATITLKNGVFYFSSKNSHFLCGKLKNLPGTVTVPNHDITVPLPGTYTVPKCSSNYYYNHVLDKMNTRTVPLTSFCFNYIGNFIKTKLWKTKQDNFWKANNLVKFSTIVFLTISNPVLADSPSSFSKAKKIMYSKIYPDNQQTFYCGCDYSNRKTNLNSCGYQIRKNQRRASRTEAEHVVPAYWLAKLTPEGRACWAKGTKLKGTNGRKYCLKNNKQFKQAHNDLMNLVPAIGEVNGDRSNYRFGMVAGEARNYGSCDIEIDRSGKRGSRRVEPAENVRGDIARIYFYMAGKYGLQLSRQSQQLMNAWNKLDPIDAWEKVRAMRIKEVNNGY